MQKARKVFSFVLSCLLCLSLIPSQGIAEISAQASDAIELGSEQTNTANPGQGSDVKQTSNTSDAKEANAINDVQNVPAPLQAAEEHADSAIAAEETPAIEEDNAVTLGQNEEPIQVQDAPAITEVQSSSEPPAIEALSSTGASISYISHVQSYGWLSWVNNGATSGMTGEAKRMEAIQLRLNGVDGGIRYRTHVQTYGWQRWAERGEVAGTTGEAKRMEALQIELTGNARDAYDVYYRTNVQDYGWMGWVKNGEVAGTTGEARRVDAIEIVLAPKGLAEPVGSGTDYMDYVELVGDTSSPGVHYATHVQSYGWLPPVANGASAGTTGEAKRVEAIKIALADVDGNVEYRAYVQDDGWTDWARNGSEAGTTGEAKRLEAIQIRLTGSAEKAYDIYYCTHVQSYGWLGWAKNGERAGTAYQSKRIESIQVVLVKKGEAGPTSQAKAYFEHNHMDGVDISGWDRGININNLDADFTIIKSTEGVQGTIYNPDYTEMADTALANGMKIGFYHYANGGNATAEAESFYQSIKDYKGRAIACLDWEGQGNKSFTTGIDVIWCKTFLDRLKELFGGTPFIYMSKSITNTYNWSNVSNSYPLWGAQYADMNDVYGYQSDPWQSASNWGSWGPVPKIFQYTSTGVLERNGGIEYFDFDLFYGSPVDWDNYCK